MLGRAVFNDSQLKLEVRQCGSHFFDKDTMQFFNSRLSGVVHPDRKHSATYFVTSEKGPHGGRKYTVRVFRKCKVDTVGAFQGHSSSEAAHRAAKKMAGG